MEGTALDNYRKMKEAQWTSIKKISNLVKGRDDILSKHIEEYVDTGGKDVPLLVLGGEGSGKSSVMAKAVNRVKHRLRSRNLDWNIFYHFVGTVPGSTCLEPMLKRLLVELDVVTASSLPKNTDSAAYLCCTALSSSSTKPAVVFVDAVAQFEEERAAMVLSWVPRKLAPQIRCIFAMTYDSPQHQQLMSRESKSQELHLTPLEFESRKMIVEDRFTLLGKRLHPDQIKRLLANQSSENPLWLTIACEELCNIDDPRLVDDRIASFPSGLLNLLQDVLLRFKEEPYGDLLVAALCLLEASDGGLLESELLGLLADEYHLTPPSPFEEKDEKECSEKESKKVIPKLLSEDKWECVYKTLKPFLIQYEKNSDARIQFYHRLLSKAVRRSYFLEGNENEQQEYSLDIRRFWHKKMADYFEKSTDLRRKAEEYLYNLSEIEDKVRLVLSLTDWDMFYQLYSEEYSQQLLKYWRYVGDTAEMVDQYKNILAELERQQPRDESLIAVRYEHVARIFLQAGHYNDALELATTVALKWEEEELGKRPERLVELYSLVAEIYDEKLKLNDFVSRSQLPELRKTIAFSRKSIALRHNFTSDYHQLRLGLSLMKLAFSLESWEACGGDSELSGDNALKEGNIHVDVALQIFQKLKDMGHYAEALMTKGVLAPRGSMEQLKFYNQAMEICLHVYGELNLLTSRLYINIGIVYEDNKDYVKAYDFFKKWARVSEAILGPNHPKTLRAKGVIKEPRYKLVAKLLKDSQNRQNLNSDDMNEINEAHINEEVAQLDNTGESSNDGNRDDQTSEVDEDYNSDTDTDQTAECRIGETSADNASLPDELQQVLNNLMRVASLNLHLHENLPSSGSARNAGQPSGSRSSPGRGSEDDQDRSSDLA